MKQAGIKKQTEKVGLRLYLAPINIHHVGKQLKGIKGNTDRQQDLRHNTGQTEQVVGRSQDQSQIFENTQQGQTAYTGPDQPRLSQLLPPVLLNHQAKDPVDQHHTYQQRHVSRLAPGIKKERKNN